MAHEDDEVLSYGAAITRELDKGSEVHLLLLTDGAKSTARKIINGEQYWEWHQVVHNPEEEGYEPLTPDRLRMLRRAEYEGSLDALGVSNRGEAEPILPDREVRMTDVKKEIRKQIARKKRVHLHALHPTLLADLRHPDHRASGQAALENGQETGCSVSYYIEPYMEKYLPEEVSRHMIRPNANQKDRIIAAAASYMHWEPSSGRFAIGYHFVGSGFDRYLKNIRSIIVTQK